MVQDFYHRNFVCMSTGNFNGLTPDQECVGFGRAHLGPARDVARSIDTVAGDVRAARAKTDWFGGDSACGNRGISCGGGQKRQDQDDPLFEAEPDNDFRNHKSPSCGFRGITCGNVDTSPATNATIISAPVTHEKWGISDSGACGESGISCSGGQKRDPEVPSRMDVTTPSTAVERDAKEFVPSLVRMCENRDLSDCLVPMAPSEPLKRDDHTHSITTGQPIPPWSSVDITHTNTLSRSTTEQVGFSTRLTPNFPTHKAHKGQSQPTKTDDPTTFRTIMTVVDPTTMPQGGAGLAERAGCYTTTLHGGQAPIKTVVCPAAPAKCTPCVGCNAPQC